MIISFLYRPPKVCFRFIHIAQPESHITDDQVVSIKGRWIPDDRNPVARRRLAGNRQIVSENLKGRFQLDNAADFKYNGPVSSTDRVSKRSLARVGQRRYLVHIAAPAAGRILSTAFGPGNAGVRKELDGVTVSGVSSA